MPRWQPTAAQVAQWQREGRIVSSHGSSVPMPYPEQPCQVGSSEATAQPVLTLVLPYPPSVNAIYRVGTDGKPHLMPEARAYRKQVATYVQTFHTGVDVPVTGRLCVTLAFHAPDARRRDLDNPLKILMDSLQHAGVYADDSQVDEYRIVRGPVRQPACVVVGIACRLRADCVGIAWGLRINEAYGRREYAHENLLRPTPGRLQ